MKQEKINFARPINNIALKTSVIKIVTLLVLSINFSAISPRCIAQEQTGKALSVHNDTINNSTTGNTAGEPTADTIAKPEKFQPNPKKAGLYSALVPGLGQLYNRQYWKVPVVYAGVAAAGYFFITNLNNYQSYRKAYIGRINNPNPTDKYVGIYTQDQLQQLQNDYNKYLNLTALLSTVGYALQVLDAITSAHLKNFDISRDISMRVVPIAMPGGAGMGLVMNF